ncbi:MAG: sugar phosphate isomerase/epimerase [Ruminococcus bromii]|nr:sugar phosphate isomerase/epimerase [Ruminococcus bromii]
MKYGTLYSYWSHEWVCDYPAVAKKVRAAGCDILEVGAPHIAAMTDAQLAELKAAAEDNGLILTTNIGPSKDQDLASPDPAIRKNGLDFLTGVLRAMDKIGSKSLVGAMYSFWPCDFKYTDKEAAWDTSIAEMKKLAAVAEDLGIDLCQEVLNRFETYIMTNAAEGVEYCKRVDSPRCKVLLDTFHMNIEEDNIPAAIRLTGDYLGHIHVGEANRKLPGQGSLDWKAIAAAVHDVHYDGNVVMEPFLLKGGSVGKDIKVWRDLSNGADEAKMDQMLADAVKFLHANFD